MVAMEVCPAVAPAAAWQTQTVEWMWIRVIWMGTDYEFSYFYSRITHPHQQNILLFEI